jgi:hypothetical protein
LGVVYVPQGPPTVELAEALVADFRQRRLWAFTEVKARDRPMRLYLDVDLEEPTPLQEAFWAELEDLIREEVQRFYPDTTKATFGAVVLASGMRTLPPDPATGKPAMYKAGIHVVFQDLYVTVDQALQITAGIIARAQKRWPLPDGGWRRRIDQAVYGEARGLRWAWQFKTTACTRCGLVDDKGVVTISKRGCPECVRGQVPDESNSMYAPLYRLCHNGVRHWLGTPHTMRTRPSVDLLLECSIRGQDLWQVTPGFVVYVGAPEQPLLGGTKAKPKVVFQGDGQVKRATASGHAVDPCTHAFRVVEAAVRSMHPAYKDLEVRCVSQFGSKRGYKVTVEGYGSRYCQNVGREHRRATVKFVVTRSGVRQECHCQREPLAGGTRCKDYASPPRRLTDSEVMVLFGDGVQHMHLDSDGKSIIGAQLFTPAWARRQAPDGVESAEAILQDLTREKLVQRMRRIEAPPSIAGLSEDQRLTRVAQAWSDKTTKAQAKRLDAMHRKAAADAAFASEVDGV